MQPEMPVCGSLFLREGEGLMVALGRSLGEQEDQKPHVGRGSSKHIGGLWSHAIGRPRLLASVCSDTGTGVNFMGRGSL